MLQVPSAKYLVASTATTNSPPHLYIVDDTTYHRIIDLQTVTNATNGTNSTSGTSMMMKLIQQYASPNLFVNVKGTVVDPKSTTLYFIVQNEQNAATRNFVTLNTTTPATCTS